MDCTSLELQSGSIGEIFNPPSIQWTQFKYTVRITIIWKKNNTGGCL